MAVTVRVSRFLAVPLALVFARCGGESEPSDTTRTLTIQSGDNQSAAAGSAVATPPSVKVSNSSGTGVSGVQVTFTVATGGGTVTGGTQTTTAQGIATVGGWTLGPTAGPNALTVTVQGSGSTVTINATGTAGPAATLAKTAGDNQTATVKTALPTKPAVRVNDQFGNAVAGAAVTFVVTGGGGSITGATQTTDALGIATVGGWTLGPTNGPNTLSAAVQGVVGIPPVEFTANGAEILIQPSKDTTFQAGTINATRLIIPAGKTVTLAGNVTINADSTVEIAGTLQGSCVGLNINGSQTVIISGRIRSDCSTTPAPPDVLIVGRGGYVLTSTGRVEASGNTRITNDPSVTTPDFPAASPRPVRGGSFAGASIKEGAACQVFGSVEGLAIEIEDDLNRALSTKVECQGDMDVGGNGSLIGHNGKDGRGDTEPAGNPAVAFAISGRSGGNVSLKATGRIAVTGPFLLRSGSGGNGGDATATATPGVAGQKAADATASGGDGGGGGHAGLFATEITGITSIRVEMGAGGDGGDAIATAANGEAGKATGEGTQAQDGGDAYARAGRGGSLGFVEGVPNLTAGRAGHGGVATAVSGSGADGSDDRIDGGNGGKVKAEGGDGGRGVIAGTPVVSGGNGGAAVWDNARGGRGWNNCSESSVLAPRGGHGGNGGMLSGYDGEGGPGTMPGKHGGGTLNHVGNAGDGGDDAVTPGNGGSLGGSDVQMNGTTTIIDPSLRPGEAGTICAPDNQLITTGVTVFSKIHDVGESSCPDPFANNLVTNVSGVPVLLQLSQSSGPALINFSLGSGTLAPNGSTNITSSFNCGQPRTFTVQLILHATGNLPGPAAGPRATASRAPTEQDVTITYNVTARSPAVRLAHALGSFQVNQVIFLGQISGGVRSAAHGASCAVEHLHATAPAGISIQGTGPFPDPDPTGCGYGEVIKQALPPL